MNQVSQFSVGEAVRYKGKCIHDEVTIMVSGLKSRFMGVVRPSVGETIANRCCLRFLQAASPSHQIRTASPNHEIRPPGRADRANTRLGGESCVHALKNIFRPV
ncbi:unnamed protein product, partial [Sphacelaria rigidula]